MRRPTHRIIVLALLAATLPCQGAENFQLRYSQAGTLCGELFAPPDLSGWVTAAGYTASDVRKITGNDGRTLTQSLPAGTLSWPGLNGTGLAPLYAANSLQINAQGTLKLSSLALGYVSPESHASGRWVASLILPYGVKSQSISVAGPTPALQWNPLVPVASQAMVQGQFNAGYQASLAADGAAASGSTSGLGDAEAMLGWLYADTQLRVISGVSVAIPTGRYSSGPAPQIGFGNFFTVRPTLQVGYRPMQDISVAAKATQEHNTTNRDDSIHSGNWAALELATGYQTKMGVVGLHSELVQQLQNDSNNAWGPSRLKSVNAGTFFTTQLPRSNVVVNLQYMKTLNSRNSAAGTFSQISVIKVF